MVSHCGFTLHFPNEKWCWSYAYLLPNKHILGTSLIAQLVNNLPAMQETLVQFLGRKIPWRMDSYPLQYSWASLVAQLVKNPPAMRESWVRSLDWKDHLEKWKAPTLVFWPGEFYGLYSVRHAWVTFTFMLFLVKYICSNILSWSVAYINIFWTMSSKEQIFLILMKPFIVSFHGPCFWCLLHS